MKSIVIYSGGIDSTVLLTDQIQKQGKENVKTIFFDYGSKHNEQELKAAQTIVKLLGVPIMVVQLGFLGRVLHSDLLQKDKDIVQEGSVTERDRVFIPFRNGIMISIAAAYADSIQYEQVCIGTHRHVDPKLTYPDCTVPFIEWMNAATMEGTYSRVKVIAPLSTITKPGIIGLGVRLAAPLDLTYSCYEGREVQCGECGTCLDRIKGFREMGMMDPGKFRNIY